MKNMDERRTTELMAKRAELEWYFHDNRIYDPYNPKTSADLANERIIIYSNPLLPKELEINRFMDEKVVNLIATGAMK